MSDLFGNPEDRFSNDATHFCDGFPLRDQSGVNINDIAGFCVPLWMIEKMRHQMLAMRTDLPKLPKHRSRSVTPNEGATVRH